MLAIGACFLVCRRSGTPLGAQEIELVLEGHGRERSGLRLRCTNPPQIPHSMNERALRAWHLLKCDESGLAGWVQGNPCLYIRLRTWRAGEVPGRPARCYRATAAAVGTPTLAVRAVGAPIVRTDCAGQHGGASCCSRWFGLSCGPASTSRVFTTITTRSGYSFHKFKRLGIPTSHSHPTVLSVNQRLSHPQTRMVRVAPTDTCQNVFAGSGEQNEAPQDMIVTIDCGGQVRLSSADKCVRCLHDSLPHFSVLDVVQIFRTYLGTLRRIPKTRLWRMAAPGGDLEKTRHAFLDKNPDCFAAVLEFHRSANAHSKPMTTGCMAVEMLDMVTGQTGSNDQSVSLKICGWKPSTFTTSAPICSSQSPRSMFCVRARLPGKCKCGTSSKILPVPSEHVHFQL